MKNYQERFAALPSLKLFKIIQDAANYDTDAVAAAKAEIAKRNLSTEETKELQDTIDTEKVATKKLKQKASEVESKVKSASEELIDIVNPVRKAPKSAEKVIMTLVVAFAIFSLYQIVMQFSYFRFLLTYEDISWDINDVLLLFAVAFLPVVTFLFWKRKKVGWILLYAFNIYTIINYLGLAVIDYSAYHEAKNSTYLRTDTINPVYHDEFTYNPTFALTQLIIAILLGLTVWVMGREDIKKHFRINHQTALLTIVVSILVSLFLFRMSI